MVEVLLAITLITVILCALALWLRLAKLAEQQNQRAEQLPLLLEEKHRAMLQDLHEGLRRLGDSLSNGHAERSERLRDGLAQSFDRLRDAVAAELKDTRLGLDALRQTQSTGLQAMQQAQTQALADNREAVIKQLADIALSLQAKQDTLRAELLETVGKLVGEQGIAQQVLLRDTLHKVSEQLNQTINQLNQTVEARLESISGKVSERLDEGFKKTNETFTSVMSRLAVIDEAQKKIDGLTSNVVSLQELLGDKRSRGAFGEVQLEHLVKNVLPAESYAFQFSLSNGTRVDCLLDLPEPTGKVAVDSKFPLENYHRMFAPDVSEPERLAAQKLFRSDVKKHIDAIGDKYIIANETADGAVMFIPAEAVFAEIHAYHPELVQYAMQKRVWIVSPTTMMAVLNTARAVIKDVETRRQVHIIKEALGKLGKEFERFDTRMKKLADHIRMAHEDAQQVQVTSEKISKRFTEIEHVRLDEETPVALTSPD